MAKNEIVCVIDKTGSMSSKRDEAITGFNTFLEEQKEDQSDDQVTLVLFNTAREVVLQNEPIENIYGMVSGEAGDGSGHIIYSPEV